MEEEISHTNPQEQDVENEKKLINTYDTIQKRFWCKDDELLVWRNILIYRYTAIPNSDIKLEVSDYDKNDQLLTSPALQWLTDIPCHLAKTTIRLFIKSDKRITVTLYFKSNSNSGTLLCQGKDCYFWDKEECEQLKKQVSSFLQNRDVSSLAKHSLCVPLSFIKPLSALTLSNPTIIPHLESTAPLQEDPSTGVDTEMDIESHASSATSLPPDSVNHPFLSCDFTPSPVVLLAPTSSATKTLMSSTELKTVAFHDTPTGTKRRKVRRKTLCVSQRPSKDTHSPLHQCKVRFEQLKDVVDDLKTSQDDMKDTLTSSLEDAKMSVKNEIKSFVRSKEDSISSKIEFLENKITILTNLVDTLTKDNKSLRDQLGSIRTEMKTLKTNNATAKARTNQNVKGYDKSESPTSPIDSQVSQAYPQPDGQPVVVAKPASPQVSERDKTKQLPHPNGQIRSGSPLVHPLPSTCTVKTPASEKSDEVECVSDQVPSIEQPLVNPTPCEKEPPSFTIYSIPVSNPFDLLSNNTSNVKISDNETQQPVTKKHNESSSQSERNIQKHSPYDILSNISVNSRATAIVIGDSVINNLDTKRLALRSYNMNKVCVSGMAISDLERWLKNQPKYENVKALIVHVGINDCPAGQVSVEKWSHTITLCKKVFPNAKSAFSSLIPAKGRQNINNAVFPTNRNLKKACNECNCTFLDNTDFFVAASGAPKLDMYNDVTHPSFKGTARLASSFKSTVLNWLSDRTPPQRHYLTASDTRLKQVRTENSFYDKKDISYDPQHGYSTDASNFPQNVKHSQNVPFTTRRGFSNVQNSAYVLPPLHSRHHFPHLGSAIHDQYRPLRTDPPPPARPILANPPINSGRLAETPHHNHRDAFYAAQQLKHGPNSYPMLQQSDMDRCLYFLNMMSQMLNMQ